MKILIIDDYPEIREALTYCFAGHGFEVSEAENGRQGLSALEQDQFAFVLTDIQMPEMDGVEFLKKAKLRYLNLPVFVMTGFSKYSQEEVLAFGASGYFIKGGFMDLAHELSEKFGKLSA